MKVVQTFWGGGKNLLIDNFGWADSQYHLMSWALSCLSLRENYDEVVIYTDSGGHKIFSELLGLPYTDIIVQYDNLACLDAHWAYPKLLTYSLQDKSFIHVDGDVYLARRLRSEIEAGALIAQNKEIGTAYYKGMMDSILSNGLIIPDYLAKELDKDSISSYNAGVLGGNDIEFIQRYCRSAFDLIQTNHLNEINNKNVNVNHNILFEQILFYTLAVNLDKTVTTVLEQNVNDNGYSYQDFCDFYSYDKSTLMHIIGGHKRNSKTCELLAQTLLKKYPEYYEKIIGLFPQKNIRFSETKNKYFSKELSNEVLLDLERKHCNYFEFLNSSDRVRLQTRMTRNPHLYLYEKKGNLPDGSRPIKTDIARVPCLMNKGTKEVYIDDLCYNILILLESEKTFERLLDELKQSFGSKLNEDWDKTYALILKCMEYLFINKLIYTDKINTI